MFPWSRERRRRDLLARPVPDQWLEYIRADVFQYASLSNAEQDKLRGDLRILVAEKNWEGCGGLAMTDEIKVTIAAQASLLLLGLEHDYFANVESILVYPASYVAVQKTMESLGIIREAPSYRLGEAWVQGPVIVSWSDALAGGRSANGGHNVVLHEFAHKLDFRDGSVDGVPRLQTRQQSAQWAQVMSEEYASLAAHSAAGELTALDAYGAVNAGEFFAVATEAFFQTPRPLLEASPRLYALLQDYYQQDPARHFAAVPFSTGGETP